MADPGAALYGPPASAVGARLTGSVTLAVVLAEPVRPVSSVTVSVTV